MIWRPAVCKHGEYDLASVAETGFSHWLTAYKIVAHFFGLWYLNISGNNQVENSFFIESVTFQLHVRMLSSEVAQSLKGYGLFLDLVVEIAVNKGPNDLPSAIKLNYKKQF